MDNEMKSEKYSTKEGNNGKTRKNGRKIKGSKRNK
jgi:hypothetical protein